MSSRCVNALFQKLYHLILLTSLPKGISQPSGQIQQSGQTNIKSIYQFNILSYFYRPLRVLSLSRNLLEIYAKAVYPTMVGESFQTCRVQITGKFNCESKIECRSFYFLLSTVPIITHHMEGNYSLPTK